MLNDRTLADGNAKNSTLGSVVPLALFFLELHEPYNPPFPPECVNVFEI